MNTIPSLFNERQINRTVLGGKEFMPEIKLRLGVILLNSKASHFRESVLKNLVNMGFQQIVCIENNADNYSIDEIAHKFPFIKFIVPLETVTEGELINIGMSECSCDKVLVIKDTLKIDADFLSSRVAEKLNQSDIFCIAPRLACPGINAFPLVFAPSVYNSTFRIEYSPVITDGVQTLYPLDNIAVYDRQKFIQLGGFDYTITSPHWQTVDFFFRSWLWGEKIQMTTMILLNYDTKYPVEDLTPDLSYSRFYMKNLLPVFDMDHGVIPLSSILVYLLRSGCGLIESLRQFFGARDWVKKNMYRFKCDAKFLVENWGKIK